MLKHDKRWAGRSPLWLRTSIYIDGKFSRYGLASDFSLQGMFLICKTSELKLGQRIEVDFRQTYDGIEKQCYVSTEIVRIGQDGIGVSFNEFDSNHFSCLHTLLSGHARNNTFPDVRSKELIEPRRRHDAA